jgi:capsular polysaccharide biosynthesis protein
LNEDKIEELLVTMGFSIYYMENYSFEQQIAIMANASIVVAPHGAGITNIFFCPTGTKIVELMLDKYTVSMFYSIALTCGHKYYPILGKFEGGNATKDEDFVWTIDLEKVQRVVEKLINYTA